MTAGNNTFVYDTNMLIGVVPNLKRPQKFLLNKFFTNDERSTTEFVSIDVDIGKRRMAPFCSPLVEGRLVEQRRYQTNQFKPPYLKDKRAPDLRKPVRRSIGERIGGTLSAGEREMANLALEMEDQIDLIDRRLEWMAASALATSTVLVVGEGFPATLIDYGRDPSLTLALTGTNQWGQVLNGAGRDPQIVPQIEGWQHLMLKLSGAVPTDIIFTTSAWTKFTQAEGVQGAIFYPNLSNNGNQIQNGPQIQTGGVFKGTWGAYNLWLYNDWYVDENNVELPMIPDGTIVLTGPQLLGTQAFATIMDPAFNYEAMPYAPKTWVEQDPAQRLLMMQSSPLVIPGRPNASMAVTVCAGTTN